MAKAHESWKVLDHSGLQKHADNLWTVAGTLPDMPLGRRMTLAKRADGSLVIHNAIALSDAAMAEIEAWGEPAVLLVPNGWHRLDAPAFKRRYPALRVLCPAATTKRVAQVVPVDGSYDDLDDDGHVGIEHLEGTARREGVMRVCSAEGTSLAFNDLLFNMQHLPGVVGFVYRLLGSTGGPGITRIGRLFIVKRRPELRAHLMRLADVEDLRRIIIMHGDMIDEQPGTVLRTIADRLV